MLTNEDLQAISQLIKNEIEPIKKDISALKSDVSDLKSDVLVLKSDVSEMKEDIEIIKEDCEITREVTNKIGEWVDFYFHEEKPYPLDENEIEKFNEGLKFAK